MTGRRWLGSALWFVLWCAAFQYARAYIHNGWGLLIWAMMALAGFWLLVNTMDLLVGRWIRRSPQPRVPAQQPVVIRRIILEEIHHA